MLFHLTSRAPNKPIKHFRPRNKCLINCKFMVDLANRDDSADQRTGCSFGGA